MEADRVLKQVKNVTDKNKGKRGIFFLIKGDANDLTYVFEKSPKNVIRPSK